VGAALIEAATVGGLIYGTLHPIGVKRSEISDFLNDNNKDEKHVLSDIKIKTPLPPAKPSDFSSLTPPPAIETFKLSSQETTSFQGILKQVSAPSPLLHLRILLKKFPK